MPQVRQQDTLGVLTKPANALVAIEGTRSAQSFGLRRIMPGAIAMPWQS